VKFQAWIKTKFVLVVGRSSSLLPSSMKRAKLMYLYLPSKAGGPPFRLTIFVKTLQACKVIKVKILLNGWWVVLDVRAERR
jgi:hypothetical protein